MYFEIENTPEHIRKSRRRTEVVPKKTKEECPRLVLAPFSKPPLVVFEDVYIGTTCERELEVFNPSKVEQQITLGKALPPGLVVELPGEWLVLEPETCYCLTMWWTPQQPTALRETIRFTNNQRGRYDVTVVLKSVTVHQKGKKQPKSFKISPGKKNKKKIGKQSPGAIYKKKAEVIYNTAKITKTVLQLTHNNALKTSNKENISTINDYSMEYQPAKCPFDSPTSIDFNFDTSEIFSNLKQTKKNVLQDTYDKSSTLNEIPESYGNVLKPQNYDVSASELFDNINFTPLKTYKTDKLVKGPKIVISLNSDSELDDSLDIKTSNNDTHSAICLTSHRQTTNKWATATEQQKQQECKFLENSTSNIRIPNTSSPKELNSLNFSMNTELSRISDLSFFPQRFSTEKKIIPKFNNDTHDLLEDPNAKLNSDTYTKDSPNSILDFRVNQVNELKPPHYFMKDQPKICRQALFKESYQYRDSFQGNCLGSSDVNVWNKDIKFNARSPPRSITPPLQSIPEESYNFCSTQVLDTTDKPARFTSTFTMNRTFDKDRNSLSTTAIQSWSKKSIRTAEPELWKIPTAPPRKSLKPKACINSKDSLSGRLTATFVNESTVQNVSINQVENVYSQSSTVDPFLSATYYYDEEAVHKLEMEFKRWLNYILTPPADLESNVEQKIDIGKAWLANRNKEVPAAPTVERVCSVYHNSHRLDSLRRSARALLMSPEIVQVFEKLRLQIEKKLIMIRPDRNLHLDVGLQKVIMELLLSYNPLWLRIGLEAIYGIVLPLKSNSDIDGLTMFIIQRVFKNPFLKNKHSKTSAPNMLLPAYMEAIKKFTLKKFFMLVYFLDQAKQKKLISHDPCLFCRNAVCKESREIIIRFTRELIAGIGDITKHLRPIGYVVSHKQSYLDEYKYAVHNIALDIRDGVRITKVMEIILMKNGLSNQLRTPAISRLQKIHNVQVALNALKEANFVIVGDITAQDIADGHREKTLSLLWQLIHVFRAPLFEKAANVIQTWWRKKYEVIVEKRKEEERIRQKLNTAARIIQCWWRRIQYNRLVKWQMKQITASTIVLQKYCRMWICRTRYQKQKSSVLAIEKWYQSVKMIRQARAVLEKLKTLREERRQKSATTLQSYVRRWLCMKQYHIKIRKVVQIQSIIRCFIIRKRYLKLKNSVMYIQRLYRGKLQMREDMNKFTEMRKAAITIQSYYKMIKERRQFKLLKNCVKKLEDRYIAVLKMRKEAKYYKKLKQKVILIQARWRSMTCRKKYLRQRYLVVMVQRKIRAKIEMKKERTAFLKLKRSAITLQRCVRSYQEMKKARQVFLAKRNAAIIIQRHFRALKMMKTQRNSYTQLKRSAIVLQKHYRALLAMRRDRSSFLRIKEAAVVLQKRYKALILMRHCKEIYQRLHTAVITVQRRYRAQLKMREERLRYLKLKSSCIIIQNTFRAHLQRKQQREAFLKQKQAAVAIQNWYRCCRKTKIVQQEFQQTRKACVTIQRVYKAYIIGKKQRQEYMKIRTATLQIQSYYRSYIEMKHVRNQFIELKTATVKIQKFYKSYLEMKKQRKNYLELKSATQFIQNYYRRYKETKLIRNNYIMLKKATVFIQNRYRSICAMRIERNRYLMLKQATVSIQQRYRAQLQMRQQRQTYLKTLHAVSIIQKRLRAQNLMKEKRAEFKKLRNACITIQRFYRAHKVGRREREKYLTLRMFVIKVQQRYKALLLMRKERQSFVIIRGAAVSIQRRYRAQSLMKIDRAQYFKTLNAIITIQRRYRAHVEGKRQFNKYLKIKTAINTIQTWYRSVRETRKIRSQYLQLRNATVFIQQKYRANVVARQIRRQEAATKIQIWYRSLQQRNQCRKQYLKIRTNVVILQSVFRMLIQRRLFIKMKNAALTIQRAYRSDKLTKMERQKYITLKTATIKLQSYVRTIIQMKRYQRIRNAVIVLQAAYRLKKQRDLQNIRRENAAICIQKNFRRYLVQSRYVQYRERVLYVQRVWRGKLVTRLLRCEYLQKRRIITKLQARLRGYLVRKRVQCQREELQKIREEQRLNWAATVVQAHYRGYKERTKAERRVMELRLRWREGALKKKSSQQSMEERNVEAIDVLRKMSDIESVIRALRSIELIAEVFPMIYNSNASSIVRQVYIYMSVTNRSISSIEVLKSGAAILVNLTRYRVTGPKIYSRDRISPILKFMLRFSNSEIQLFCILCTYLWLFSKYDGIREDLTEFLHIPENLKMLSTIKANVDRMKRMASNIRTPQAKSTSVMNMSICSSSGKNERVILPALEPDYGIMRADKPRYFADAPKAISCLFATYKLA